jgi:rSAM/selenodomain-associated transferase 1
MSGAAETCLVVFARAPIPGRVKTRLQKNSPHGRALSADEAAHLYRAFLTDVLDKGAAAGYSRRRLYIDGSLDDKTLQELSRPRGYELRAQVTGDLGARLQAASSTELHDGAHAVVIIGSDSPTLPVTFLEEARAKLTIDTDNVEVVLGPATDGGYYLIGLRRSCPELFSPGIPWSTSGVLPVTLERLARLGEGGIGSAILPIFYDCDTPEDLRLLVATLKHARSQKAAGVVAPHTEQALSELSLI